MPNILKRPMFRRGGSVAYGTGITSGLEERRNYQEGGFTLNPSMEGYEQGGTMDPRKITEELTKGVTEEQILESIKPGIYDRELYEKSQQPMTPDMRNMEAQMGVVRGIEESMRPTGREEVADVMASIAATSPDDPTKLQTFGQVLGKAGAAKRGLEKKREEGLQQFRREAGLQVLKSMTDDEKDQLFRYAKEYAKRTGMSEADAYKLFLDRYLQGTPPKGLTRENLIAGYQKQLLDNPGLTYGAGDALTVARTQAEIFKNKAPVANPSPVKIYGNEADAKDFKGYRPGEKVINPEDGGIYTFDGMDETGTKAKFTKVWPTK